jgi:hypothetical protein
MKSKALFTLVHEWLWHATGTSWYTSHLCMCSECFHCRHKSCICLLFSTLVTMFSLQICPPTKPLNLLFAARWWGNPFGWPKREDTLDVLASLPVSKTTQRSSSGKQNQAPIPAKPLCKQLGKAWLGILGWHHSVLFPDEWRPVSHTREVTRTLRNRESKIKETLTNAWETRRLKGREGRSIFLASSQIFWIWKQKSTSHTEFNRPCTLDGLGSAGTIGSATRILITYICLSPNKDMRKIKNGRQKQNAHLF